MKSSSLVNPLLAAIGLVLSGCARPASDGWQGYLEGEFVYVASPLAGRLDELKVQRGNQVDAGAPLFALEHASESAAQREAADRLRVAEARLADLQKGSRPTELASLEARLQQARASAELSQRELARQEELFKSAAIAATEFDRARLTHERNLRAIEELSAQLATARLGARSDTIAAAEAEVAAAEAAKSRADWAVTQKVQSSPQPALVHDTLFRAGEFVPAGRPIVALLPPENLKVRFFVPEADLARIRPGESVHVTLSGRADPLPARISYVSPRPEYTPPVLYNRANRAKLVFMVEAAIAEPAAAAALHPGLPVDVALAPR